MNKYVLCIIINLMLVLIDFIEENGVMCLIFGSQDWDDFDDVGILEMMIFVLLKVGDVVLFGGKVVYGGGVNVIVDFYCCGLIILMQVLIIMFEEVYLLIVLFELVRMFVLCVQKIFGFCFQYFNGSLGLW